MNSKGGLFRDFTRFVVVLMVWEGMVSTGYGQDQNAAIPAAQVAAPVSRLADANAALPELKSFVLPGGNEAASRLHIARATCRRAERDVLAAHAERAVNPLALVYLNRLSDLLFILAREANGGEEPLWEPGKSR